MPANNILELLIIMFVMVMFFYIIRSWVEQPISDETRKILNLSRDGLVILNKKGEILLVNQAAERLLGETWESLQHKNITSINYEIAVAVVSAIELQKSKFAFLTLNNISMYVKVYVNKSAKEWWKNHGLWWKDNCVLELEDVTEYTYSQHAPTKSQKYLYDLVYIDHLTSAFNRRYFDTEIPNILMNAMSENLPISLLLLDIDKFKEINDTHGHQVGDIVLKFLVESMKRNSRKEDMVFRLGGDEFALLLVNTSEKVAMARAQQLCNDIFEAKVDALNRHIKLTISIGVATFPKPAASLGQLLQFSDNALYHAKAEGRNCIRLYTTPFIVSSPE